jgi:hypothetical protein
MIRRLISSAVVFAALGSYAFADPARATFVLTDGERKSGKVVFHTESRENLIDNHLNLGTDDGREITFPVDQVAVIDFSGGRPGQTELQALPADNSTHLLVLRNGSSQQGHLVNLIGGDTLRWRAANGQEQPYPITDVARVYLNPSSARTVFNFTPAAPATTATATSGTIATSGQPTVLRTITVPGTRQWNDTGITVTANEMISFRTSGQVSFMRGANSAAGPDGNEKFRHPNYPVPSAPVGALIGRVGNSAPFAIGSQTQPIAMPASGQLMLGVNDDNYGDNSGAFTVVVAR